MSAIVQKVKPQVGEVWHLRHNRKGSFVAKLLTDPSQEVFDVEIVKGKARMVSMWNRDAVPGDQLALRRTLCTFVKKES